jgi:isopenicillin N synthase-like dioxygenase
MTESIVPTIDVSGWASGDRDGIAAALYDASTRIGFYEVVGHGLDPALAGAAMAAADRFFALPAVDKARYRSPSPEINRGYAAVGDESLTYSLGIEAPPDLFEAFNIGPALEESDTSSWFAPNIWPDEVAELRPALTAWFASCDALSRTLAEISAVALGMPDDFFASRIDHAVRTMRVNNYVRPPGSADPLPGQQRMGAHTDYGLLTVLLADPVPGLQIIGPDGDWHDVLPSAGALLVNLGDLLAQWTNDRWTSTVHRVVPPPAATDGPARRRSIAFFNDANADALVEVLPTCVGADRPARYQPVTAGDHLMAKLLGPRTLQPSTAVSTLGDRQLS